MTATVKIMRDEKGNASYCLIIKDGKTLKVSYDSNKGFKFEGNRALIPSVSDMLKLVYPSDTDQVTVITEQTKVKQWGVLGDILNGEGIGAHDTDIIVPSDEFWFVYGWWMSAANIDINQVRIRTDPNTIFTVQIDSCLAADSPQIYMPPNILPLPPGSMFTVILANDAGIDSAALTVFYRKMKTS